MIFSNLGRFVPHHRDNRLNVFITSLQENVVCCNFSMDVLIPKKTLLHPVRHPYPSTVVFVQCKSATEIYYNTPTQLLSSHTQTMHVLCFLFGWFGARITKMTFIARSTDRNWNGIDLITVYLNQRYYIIHFRQCLVL